MGLLLLTWVNFNPNMDSVEWITSVPNKDIASSSPGHQRIE